MQAVSERYKTKDPIEVLGRTCTGPERRWEALVNQLMETHGLYGWHRFQQSLFGLPREIRAEYDFLEAEEGRIFDHAEQKLYHTAFFKKASGLSVINALQMEELTQEQIETGNVDLQE